jgi:hypothetical protein
MKTIERPQLIITTTLFVLLALLALVLLMSGCVSERIEGNRDLITQDRPSQPFSEVVSSESFSVKIISSDETRIEVKGESNVLPYLSTQSNGTTLTLKYTNGYNIHEHYPVEIFLYTDVLNAVSLSGSGTVDCGYFEADDMYLNISGSGGITGDFETENLEAVVSGSGNMNLSGYSKTGLFSISGSGNINAQNLDLEQCSANISGSGNINTYVTKTLDATISGSGSIFYYGNPVVKTHISGSGNLVRY